MATKSIHKEKNFDVSKTAKQFDEIIDRVKQYPVFVVDKNNHFYRVIEYKKQRVIVDLLPTRDAAEKICERYNTKKTYSDRRKKEIAENIKTCAKYHHDISHYLNSLQTAEDSDTRTNIWNRLQDAEIKQQYAVKKLESLI